MGQVKSTFWTEEVFANTGFWKYISFLTWIFDNIIYCLLSRSNGGWGGNNGKLLGWWGEGSATSYIQPPQPWAGWLHLPSYPATFTHYQLHLPSNAMRCHYMRWGKRNLLHSTSTTMSWLATFTLLPGYIYPLPTTFTFKCDEVPLHEVREAQPPTFTLHNHELAGYIYFPTRLHLPSYLATFTRLHLPS